jgi:maltose/maltodextrin transport system substrate-binding protein
LKVESIIRRRLLGAAAGTGVAAAALAVPSAVRALAATPLTLWFTVEGSKGLRAVGERFTAETGVPLIIETPDPQDGPSRFQQSAGAGKGPDLYVYAHDRAGEWAAAGLLHAVNPSRAFAADIEPLAWQGYTQRGRVLGYPLALEAITLVYNKALVKTPPSSFEEVFALDAALRPQGKRAILWDYTNTYFTWPLMAAHGGYAYKPRGDGTFDARNIGVSNPGAKVGAELLGRLLREGLMPAGSGYAEMEAAVAQGRVAMMINGPWSWVNLQRVGLDFGVAPLPRVAGKAAVPFVGVKGVYINRATRQREVAVEFVERYMLSLDGLRRINQAEPLGAPASRAFSLELQAQPVVGPRIAGILQSAREGTITPSNPEMGRFWSALKTALTNLSEGRQSPAQALDGAALRMKDS